MKKRFDWKSAALGAFSILSAYLIIHSLILIYAGEFSFADMAPGVRFVTIGGSLVGICAAYRLFTTSGVSSLGKSAAGVVAIMECLSILFEVVDVVAFDGRLIVDFAKSSILLWSSVLVALAYVVVGVLLLGGAAWPSPKIMRKWGWWGLAIAAASFVLMIFCILLEVLLDTYSYASIQNQDLSMTPLKLVAFVLILCSMLSVLSGISLIISSYSMQFRRYLKMRSSSQK